MRDRRRQPDADCRAHHLPEAEQRRGSTGFLAERRERLRGAERIDDAHAEQEHAHAGKERQEGGVEQRHQQDRDAAGAASSSPPWIERSSPKRGASFVASMPAANTIITVPAKNRPSWIGVKCSPSIRTRGAAENIANSPPMIRRRSRPERGSGDRRSGRDRFWRSRAD